MRKLSLTFVLAALALSGACKGKEDGKAEGDKAVERGKGGGDGKGPGGGDGKGGGKGGPAVKAIQIAIGNDTSCALMEGGTVRCWGGADVGLLGGGRAPTQAAGPVEIPGVRGATRLVLGADPGASGDLACVLDAAHQVTCWGGGEWPEIRPDKDRKPTVIPGLAGTRQLALGGGHGYALLEDGTVKGWGGNVFNVLAAGKDAKLDRPVLTTIPVTDVALVAAGQNHGCVAHGDGTVTCWGYSGIDPTKVEGVAEVTALAAANGGDRTCAITKAKKVVCWSGGRLVGQEVAGLDDVVALASRTHTCAVKGDGTVWCWGGNRRGQLGTGTFSDETSSRPQQVKGLSDAIGISTGAQTTCALRKTGEVACWGYNRYGQLGDGTLVDRAEPVLVKHLNDKATPAPPDGLAEVQEATTRQAFDGLPAGCTHAGSIERRFRDVEAPLPIVSAYATNEDGKGLTYKVTLANYALDPARLWDPARGDQLKLSLRFAKIDLAKDKTPLPIVPGVYSMDTKQDQLVYPSVADRASDNIMLGSITLDGLKAGEVELTHVGTDWVCGELRLQTDHSRFAGPFAARVVGAK